MDSTCLGVGPGNQCFQNLLRWCGFFARFRESQWARPPSIATAKSPSNTSEFSDIHASVSVFSSPSFTLVQNRFLIMAASVHIYSFPPHSCPLPQQHQHPGNEATELEISQPFYPLGSEFYFHLFSAPTQLPAPTSLKVLQKFPVCCIPWPSFLPLPYTIFTCFLFFSELITTSFAPRTHTFI